MSASGESGQAHSVEYDRGEPCAWCGKDEDGGLDCRPVRLVQEAIEQLDPPAYYGPGSWWERALDWLEQEGAPLRESPGQRVARATNSVSAGVPVAKEALRQHADLLAALVDALLIEGDDAISGNVRSQAHAAVVAYRGLTGVYDKAAREPMCEDVECPADHPLSEPCVQFSLSPFGRELPEADQ